MFLFRYEGEGLKVVYTSVLMFFLAFSFELTANNKELKWNQIDSAIQVLEIQGPNSLELAEAYYKAGRYKTRFGSVPIGHEYYYKAIRIYEKHKEQHNKISVVYYMIASDYLQTLDEASLKKTIQKLQELADLSPSPPVLYHLSSIKGVYYYSLLRNHNNLIGIRDSSIKYFKQSIHLVETNRDSMDMHLVVTWNYYNVAYLYNHYFSPSLVDSTQMYWQRMKKAKIEYEKFAKNHLIESSVPITNMNIAILYLQAWIQYYKKDYRQAEASMFQSMELLGDPDEDVNYLSDYEGSYTFLANLYETTKRPSLALKYQKLLNDTQKKLFDVNKSKEINKLAVQYETEQKEYQITTLKQENKLMTQNIIITITLTVFFFMCLLLSWVLFQFKRRHLNQQIYEALLNSDLQKEQAELNIEKIQLLEDEQKHLLAFAKENGDKAKEYEQRLDEIKRILSHKPSQIIVEKLKILISNSIVTKELKIKYLENIEALDLAYFEDLEINAKEKISAMDLKYLFCFAINMTIQDISLIFNVEPSSIYSVRYRIRKKIGRDIF